MSVPAKLIPIAVAAVALLVIFALLATQLPNLQVLNPSGLIADQERGLILLATALMLLVVTPVFAMTAIISWRYRAGNHHAKYTPDWDHNLITELAWWAFPGLIISILAVVAWQSAHALDPFQPLNSKKSITIQVVALQWKWLFIYPAQNIATVNLVEFPKDTDVNFQITSDAPMNSFWIPKLGGQIYAMSGMATQLHLIANQSGSFPGSSANISGSGFSSMTFTAKSVSPSDFNDWVNLVKQTARTLDATSYSSLARPASSSVLYYSSTQSNLFDSVIMKYTSPMPTPPSPSYNAGNPNNL